MTDAMIWEIAKTALQLMVTAGIAWFTVTAALRRFKAEKTWERRLDAYGRAVTALGNMQSVVTEWLSLEEMRREPSDKRRAELMDRYRAAEVELEQVASVSRLIVPDNTYEVLAKLLHDIDRIEGNTAYEYHDKEATLIAKALELIVANGKTALN